MTELWLQGWAAVAPGIDVASDHAAWQAWAADPRPLRGETRPDVKFLPAMQRRRCDGLSRMMLAVANACCPESLRGDALSVFASRHGSFDTTVSMLETLAKDEPLSPTQFSHSVHNTQAGLFSIWANDQQLAQSLASRNETFEHGFLEAVCLLARSGGRPVLFVTGDEALPEPVAHLSDDPHPPYAVGLLLGSQPVETGGAGIRFDLETGQGADPQLAWPRALEFVRWWLAKDECLALGDSPRRFSFRRQS